MANNSLSFTQVTSNATVDPDVVTPETGWFKNIKSKPGLQLHDGIDNFCAANPSSCNSR